MHTVRASGRTFVVEKITHAMIVKDQLTVFPAEYHQVTLAGEDMARMIAALREAGFAGEDILINPSRVSLVEEHGANARVYLEGADRLLYLPAGAVAGLFPAPESGEKPRRAKKAPEA